MPSSAQCVSDSIAEEGSVETARQGTEDVNAEDRRSNLVVRKLGRYRVKVKRPRGLATQSMESEKVWS